MTKREDAQYRTDLRHLAKELATEISERMVQLGAVLRAIHAGQLYYHWGFTNWQVYVESEVGVRGQDSYHLMHISRWVEAEKLTKAQQRKLLNIGIRKAYYISQAAKKKTVISWIEKAKEHTLPELRHLTQGKSPATAKKSMGFWVSPAEERIIKRALNYMYDTASDYATQGELLASMADKIVPRKKRKASR